MVAVGIVVTAFNRPLSLLRTLNDLRHSTLDDVVVAVVDDGSVDGVTSAIVAAFSIPGVRVIPVLRPTKPLRAAAHLLPVVGPYARDLSTFTVHEALRDGVDALLAAAPGLRLLVNVDSDLRLRRDWLTTLRRVFERERQRRGPLILTGFHAPNHPVLEVCGDHVVKASVGGANLMFDVDTWRDVVRPQLALHWDWHVVAEMGRRGFPLLCTRPSVVQHAGRRGRFSRPRAFDQADDFTDTRCAHVSELTTCSSAGADEFGAEAPSTPGLPHPRPLSHEESRGAVVRRLAICIATHRRPASLHRLLQALLDVERPAASTIEVRVVDNDPEASARDVVAAFAVAAGDRFAVRFSVEPRPGVTHVRNHALDLGPADLVAFIDDDEWPARGWLVDLVTTLDETGADAVIGPVIADLPDAGPPWQRPRFRGAPCAAGGAAPWVAGRTGNALVRGPWFFDRGLRFDDAFTHSGGEDADLFSRLDEAGAVVVSSTATVFESVAPDRLSLQWLLRRQHQHGMNFERIRARRTDTRHPVLRSGGYLARLAVTATRTAARQLGRLQVDADATLEVALKAAWVAGLVREQLGLSSSTPVYGAPGDPPSTTTSPPGPLSSFVERGSAAPAVREVAAPRPRPSGWAAVWQQKGAAALASSPASTTPTLGDLLRADGFDTPTGVVDDDAWLQRGRLLAVELGVDPGTAADGGNDERTILEVGCGAGAMLLALQHTGAHLVGVDPATSLLALARRALPGGRFLEGSAQAIPVDDASADAVVAHSVFAYFDTLDDVDGAVGELVRVARPGAAIAILDVPDLELRTACEAERARLVGSTAAGRGGLQHLYVPRARIADAARRAGRRVRFTAAAGDHAMSRFRFDAWLLPV